MNTSASVANFYVDRDGNEQPIRYKAADLVNKLAPDGYHWEWRNDARDYNDTITYADVLKAMSYYPYSPYKSDTGPEFDCYVCVKDKS